VDKGTTNGAPSTHEKEMSDNKIPTCYGKLWEKDHPMCSGGLDPSYTHPQTGRHVRDACDYYTTCSVATQAGKIVPVQNLLRQTMQAGMPVQQPTMMPGQTAITGQQGQIYGYQQMMPVNYQMPAYLTVAEDPANSLGKRLLILMFRAMGKAFGHALSNFFDMNSFGRPPTPPALPPPASPPQQPTK